MSLRREVYQKKKLTSFLWVNALIIQSWLELYCIARQFTVSLVHCYLIKVKPSVNQHHNFIRISGITLTLTWLPSSSQLVLQANMGVRHSGTSLQVWCLPFPEKPVLFMFKFQLMLLKYLPNRCQLFQNGGHAQALNLYSSHSLFGPLLQSSCKRSGNWKKINIVGW